MGAYTVSAGSNFNGFSCADVKTFYVGSPQDADPENLNARRLDASGRAPDAPPEGARRVFATATDD
jgi:hypothetical protein